MIFKSIQFFLFFFILFSTSFASNCQKEREFAFKNFSDIYKEPKAETQCCKNLKPLSAFQLGKNNECLRVTGPFYQCMPCGDGVCDFSEYENKCNCPVDCKTYKKDCSSIGELVILKETSSWSSSWYPRKCCKGLSPKDKALDATTCIKP